MLKTLLGLLLATSLADPIKPMPLELIYSTAQLESLPFPVLIPYLPEEFELRDVRMQVLPNAFTGQVQSYTLVFASKQQSFMLQSRPDGYRLNDSHCGGQVLETSRPFRVPELAWEPQTLELVSPACAVTGQTFNTAAISSVQAISFWRQLHWYLPLTMRKHPAHLLLFNPELR